MSIRAPSTSGKATPASRMVCTVGPPKAEPSGRPLEQETSHHAGDGAPQHGRADDPYRLVLVDVDDPQVEDHQQRHEHRRGHQSDRKEAEQAEASDDDDAAASETRNAPIWACGSCGKSVLYSATAMSRFLGRRRESRALLAHRLGGVLVTERVAAADAVLEPRHVVAALIAGDQGSRWRGRLWIAGRRVSSWLVGHSARIVTQRR